MARRSGGRKIDFKHWTTATGALASLATGTPAAVTMLAAQHLPETILRTRGEVAVSLEGVQAGGAGVGIACGLILVPEGTSTTVLWDPQADGEAPWLWWDFFNIIYEEYVTDVIESVLTASARRVIDSKAMRRVVNMELQFVATNTTLLGASSVNVTAGIRVLAGT